jgi:hypothetical protein
MPVLRPAVFQETENSKCLKPVIVLYTIAKEEHCSVPSTEKETNWHSITVGRSSHTRLVPK